MAQEVLKVDQAYPYLAIIAKWIHDEWGYYRPDRTFDDVVEHFRALASDAIVPSLYVAEVDGAAAGTACLVECDLPLRKEYTPWLASVFVAPPFRGRGVASKLIGTVETIAKSNGIRRLYLFTPNAQDLYRKAGWADLEELEYRNEVVTVMSRNLLD